MKLEGIHHITAITADGQKNLDFYVGVLGLRLVKRTVNFDDPTTYHFYFGDEQGRPGSILTFFPWPDARRGRQGGGQVAVTSFVVRPSSVGFWIERLIRKHVEFAQPVARYEDERSIIITTNLERDELAEQINERTVSRLEEMCEVLPLWGADARQQHHDARSA